MPQRSEVFGFAGDSSFASLFLLLFTFVSTFARINSLIFKNKTKTQTCPACSAKTAFLTSSLGLELDVKEESLRHIQNKKVCPV
jgi:hypothetical protein